MADNPRDKIGKCRVLGGDECEDCREKNISDIKMIHFTECMKPWKCKQKINERNQLCNHFHYAWYRIRRDLEASLNFSTNNDTIATTHNKSWLVQNSFGYCIDE